MSPLETFYILFKSNAKDVKKDTTEAAKAVNEFDQQIKQTDQSAAALGLTFQKMVTLGITALTEYATISKFSELAKKTYEYNTAIEKQTRLTGLNARELQAWDDVVQQAGGSAGEFSAWITELSEKYQAAGLGDKIKNIIPNLKEFSERIKDLDQQSAFSLGEKLGIPRDVVLALKQGPEALQAILDKQEQIRASSGEGAKTAREFARSWQEAGSQVGSAFTDLENIVLPFFTKVLNFLNTPLPIPKWLQAIIPDFFLTPVNPTAAAFTPSSGGPLGIRTNNPGNLRPGGHQAVYGSLDEGIDAEKNLLRKYSASGNNTLAGIASRWAPPNENDTRAYIADLSRTTGFGPNDHLDLNDPSVMAKVANAINKHENGAAYGSLVGGDSSVTKSVSIGQITIHTQATDARGIADTLHSSLNQHFSATIGNHDDAVKY